MNYIEKSTFDAVTLYKLGSSIWGNPHLYVYSFILDGLMIDTGHPKIGRDYCKTLETEHIDKIILTHHHEDHCGNTELIKQLKGIDAFASPKCCLLIQKPKRVEPARMISWGQPSKVTAIPLDVHQDLITKHNYILKIIETPGHSIDQISLYEANHGWLFSGDIFVNDYIKIFMRDEDIQQQISSIKTLLQLDFDVLFCNHQPIFNNGKGRLSNKLRFLEDYLGSVKKEYEQGKSPKEIMATLQLKENRLIKVLSLGQLSQLNMVTSVIRSLQR